MQKTHFRISLPVLIVILAVVALAAPAAQAQQPDSELAPPAYAAGRVLVKLKSDFPLTSTNTLLSAYGAVPREEIAPDTFAVSVPVGQEQALLKQLKQLPAVELATLALPLTMPSLRQFDAAVSEIDIAASSVAGSGRVSQSAGQAATGVLTDTLHMSAAPAGPPLPESTLPTESPQAYVVFDYENLVEEPIRVQVYATDVQQAPIVIFDTTQVLDGSGTATVVVPASAYFVDTGTFPIGHYTTLLQEGVGGSWRTIASLAWHVSTQPDDPFFLADRYQWNLHNTGRWGTRDADIDAPEAWDVTTGSEDVTIAIISSGVAQEHPDLKHKIWRNEGEIPGNGIDDDGNGYVDDVNGYEFFLDEDNPDPSDEVGYGTFAAGIAAAETNNQIGMAGVSWGARIMPIKVVRLFVSGSTRAPYGYVPDLIQGLHYAADNGAQVIFVAPTVTTDNFDTIELLRQAVEYAEDKGCLVIGVAGDQGSDEGVWPALFPHVLAVGATDYNDQLTTFSNVGQAVRDGLVAPGKLIMGTCMSYLPACSSNYDSDPYGQTAWAAAQVAGVASLVWSVNPELTAEEVRARILETADDLGPSGPDQLYGHGRLNAGEAVRQTRHFLNLDIPELYFLVDDQDEQVCRLIRNSSTGLFSWSAIEDVDWLQVNGPTGTFTHSDLEVCVVRPELDQYGTYNATLTILSTIDTQTEPLDIPVTAEYVPHKTRIYLPAILR